MMMSGKLRLIQLGLLLGAGMILCVPGEPAAAQSIAWWNKNCKKLYAQYQKQPGHKAFAVSRVLEGAGQGCGYVYRAPSKSVAEKEAIKSCKRAGAVSGCAVLASE
jgi:hypothetical protein